MIRKISSEEVISIFLDFFKRRDHLKIEGQSLVPRNDPSLLFINSGMAPLKSYFLGQERPPAPDLCNVQRCIRTNDIEEVGDRHHLTFFEMMGSWSIGHYWKREAITLAWKLLVEGFGYPPDKLYATVYRGDPELGIAADEESIEHWRSVGLPGDHIVPLGKDNFWGPAGEYGPCGPCTEVFFDTGDEFGPAYYPGGHFDDVNRYIEIWNAGVFMEFNKLPSGFSRLEMRSVDTGSGLERMVMALNGFESVYETDMLRPLVDFTIAELGSGTIASKAPRVIADHVRAVAMLLADGVKPAASGPGYIPRRLIRRAIATAFESGNKRFDFAGLMQLAIDNAKPWNAHVPARRDEIVAIFSREKEDFEELLENGITKLADAYAATNGKVDGATAFTLFATYGMPIDTVREYVVSRGGSLDEDGFQAEFRKHQDVSRKQKDNEAAGGPVLDVDGLPETEFVGYTHLQTSGTILAILRDNRRVDFASAGDEVLVITDKTSFYVEGGGQVSDHGLIVTGEARCAVVDMSKPAPKIFAHKCLVKEGTLRKGALAELSVDANRRRSVQSNHSATHLLHSALRAVLGKEVGQAGSLVDADRLRFDFTYGDRITDEQLVRIEDMVNQAIHANYSRSERIMPFDEAVAAGALAFFKDKYGDTVRTIGFGDYSTELCGGTHVASTGEVGLFVIVSEGSVARGVRRIQALTGQTAYEFLRGHDRVLSRIGKMLNGSPDELESRVAALIDKSKVSAPPPSNAVSAKSLAAGARKLSDGTSAVIASPDIPFEQLRRAAIETAQEIGGIAVLAIAADDKARVAIAVHDSRTKELSAAAILKRILPLIDGRGGGKATLAEGAGPRVAGIADILARADSIVGENA
jgi:alanyl-tRNA synthetase